MSDHVIVSAELDRLCDKGKTLRAALNKLVSATSSYIGLEREERAGEPSMRLVYALNAAREALRKT